MDNALAIVHGCNQLSKSVKVSKSNKASPKSSNRSTGSLRMISSDKQSKTSNLLTKEDLAFQEARRNRTVRKLDFEIR